jgi:uncharacterized repeat protein (TIGR03803 family)
VYGLVTGPDGCFYGTTTTGGTNGDGTLFRVCNDELTTLVHFGATNGSFPLGELTVGYDGNIYGATAHGGIYSTNHGTVFRIRNGVFGVVGTFDPSQGYNPEGGVVQSKDGNLYGAMTYGSYLFRCSKQGVITPMFSFSPFRAKCFLTAASDGNLYGCLTDLWDPSLVATPSIFRLVEPPRITTLNVSNQNAALTWTSFTNGVYQVEHKASMESTNWTPRFPTVTATQSVSSFFDSPSGTTGYYRVVLLP